MVTLFGRAWDRTDLLRLVGDLLFVAQIEAGKLAIEREPCDLLDDGLPPVPVPRGRALDRRLALDPEPDGLAQDRPVDLAFLVPRQLVGPEVELLEAVVARQVAADPLDLAQDALPDVLRRARVADRVRRLAARNSGQPSRVA